MDLTTGGRQEDPLAESTYDLIVIGAGAVGENVADRAVQGGLSVVIVERALVGGACSYWACMPSKALLRSATVLRATQNVDGAKQAVTGAIDVAAVLRRRDRDANNWDDASQVSWLESAGIDLVRGDARISGERTVEVRHGSGAVEILTARHAVAVCTGSVAILPEIPGLSDGEPWGPNEATSVSDAASVPPRLAVIGGGVVACELATAFAALGSKVTMLVRSDLLNEQEPFAGELVAEGLAELGVDIRRGVSVRSVERAPDDDGVRHPIDVILDDATTLVTDRILVAVGRAAATGGLGLSSVNGATAPLADGDWIGVDETMRVPGTDWLYAVGDVNHRSLLTHQGKYQARAAGDAIAARAGGAPVDDSEWGTHVATADRHGPAQVIFTDPEVASVGLTARAAEAAGLNTRVVDFPIGEIAGSSVHRDGYRGQARLVVDEDRQVVVGATFVGPDVGEMLHAATIAVVGEVPIERLWHAVPAYPTMSEVWLRLLEAYGRPGPAAMDRPAEA